MGTKVSKWGPTWEQWLSPLIPFSLSPCEPRLFWQNQLAELIFKKKKPRQNWSRDHFEATQKANFSIPKPNSCSRKKSRGRTGQETTLKQPKKLIFQSRNQIFG